LLSESIAEDLNMKRFTPPILLAGSQLNRVRHVCAFLTSDDEEYRVMLPFMKDGLASGGILQQNPFYTAPEEFPREYRQRRTGRSGTSTAAA
jgi:hypothetical protein